MASPVEVRYLCRRGVGIALLFFRFAAMAIYQYQANMKFDISYNYIRLLFVTAITVTMVAITTALTSNTKTNYRTVILRLQSDLKNMGKLLLMEYEDIYRFLRLLLTVHLKKSKGRTQFGRGFVLSLRCQI